MTCQILSNARLATMVKGIAPYGLQDNAAIVLDDERIRWVGSTYAVPTEFKGGRMTDLEGRLVTPAPIDCHSHLIAGGDRSREFEMRLKGATYTQIAQAGGGINATVEATRAASEEQLLAEALPKVDALIAEGVALIEVKSGYGLDRDTELRMLRAARRIAEQRPVHVRTTFLGAHAIPSEYMGRDDAYIDEICIPALKRAHAEQLVDAVDGFCEGIAFQADQIERVFKVAKELGLPVKLHAEQLSNIGGSKLAAGFGAMSVDHLEYTEQADVQALAKSGSVAVLLPGAFYTLREQQLPPVELLRKYKVPIAIATDCNPGSSPLASLLLTMNMACTLFGLTPEEALDGVTCNAARALGLIDRGQIAVGQRADLAVWNVKRPAELSYRIGFNPLHARYFGGKL